MVPFQKSNRAPSTPLDEAEPNDCAVRFPCPSPAFAKQWHCHQFSIGTTRFWTRPFEEWNELESDSIYYKKHPQTKIIKSFIGDKSSSVLGFFQRNPTHLRTFCTFHKAPFDRGFDLSIRLMERTGLKVTVMKRKLNCRKTAKQEILFDTF
jgi:hypothetical protein